MTQPWPPQFAQPQQPQQPQYAPPPMPQYPAGAAPQYQPPQYAPQQQFQQPAPQPGAPGTLDAFYSQPSTGGGPALKFTQQGDSYTFEVARDVTNADVQQSTNPQGQPQFFSDGRAKFHMKVPVKILQAPPAHAATFTEGVGVWYVKGQSRDELARAMKEAGIDTATPKAGDIGQVTFVSTRPSGAGYNPAKIVQVNWARQGGAPASQPAATSVPTPPAPAVAVPAPAPALNYPPQPPVDAYAASLAALQQATSPVAVVETVGAPPPHPTAPAPVAGGAGGLQRPEGMSDEQWALAQKLAGIPTA